MKYFRLARAAMNSENGSILLLDMLGGHAGESNVRLRRQNEISGELPACICYGLLTWI